MGNNSDRYIISSQAIRVPTTVAPTGMPSAGEQVGRYQVFSGPPSQPDPGISLTGALDRLQQLVQSQTRPIEELRLPDELKSLQLSDPALFNYKIIKDFLTQGIGVDGDVAESDLKGMAEAVSYRKFESIGDAAGYVLDGLKAGWYMSQLSEVGYSLLGNPDDPDLQRRRDELVGLLPDAGDPAPPWHPVQWFRGAAEQIPRWIMTWAEASIPSATAGIAVAAPVAVAGQIGPQAVFPEELVTVPAAFATGYGAMIGPSLKIISARKMAGLAFLQLSNIRDENGDPLDPSIARWTALAVGAFQGVVEGMQMGQLGKLFNKVPGGKKVFTDQVSRVLQKLVRNGTIKAIASSGWDFTKYTLGNTVEEIVQMIGERVGEEVAKSASNAYDGTEFEQEWNTVLRDGLAEVQHIGTFALLGSAGTVSSLRSNLRFQQESAFVKERVLGQIFDDMDRVTPPLQAEDVKAVAEWEPIRAENVEAGIGDDLFASELQSVEREARKQKAESRLGTMWDALEDVSPAGLTALERFEKQRDIYHGMTDRRLVESQIEQKRFQEGIKKALDKKRYDDAAKLTDKAIHYFIDSQRVPQESLPSTEVSPEGAGDLEVYQRAMREHGDVVEAAQDLSPALKAIARKIERSYQEIGLEAYDYGIIHNVLEHYVGRIWDWTGIDESRKSKIIGEMLRKFGTATRHAKHRIFPTIFDGWKYGLNLKVESATNNLRILKEEMIRAIENKRFLMALTRLRDADGEPLLGVGRRLRDDDIEIKHPNFRVWRPVGFGDAEAITKTVTKMSEARQTFRGDEEAIKKPVEKLISVVKGALQARGFTENEANTTLNKLMNAKGKEVERIREVITKQIEIQEKVTGFKFKKRGGPDYFINEDGMVFLKQTVYAPKTQADVLNKILGVSGLTTQKWAQEIRRYNSIFKQIILTSSLYHHFAFMRSYFLGAGHKKIADLNLITAFRKGAQMLQDADPEVMLLVENGLTAGVMQDWEESLLEFQTGLGKMVDKVLSVGPLKPVKIVKDAIMDIGRRQKTWLFERYGAGLKIMAALREFQHEMRLHPDHPVDMVAKRAAAIVNEDFGGLHLQRLVRDPTKQHIFQMVALAPDWTESNVRTMIGVLRGSTVMEKMMYKEAKGLDEKGKMELWKKHFRAVRHMHQAFWLRAIVKGLGFTAIANFALAGFAPEKWIERYKQAWEDGNLAWLKVDITPIYRMLADTGAYQAVFGKESEAQNDRFYFSAIGHFQDFFKFVFHPIRSAKHKGSVFTRVALEILTGSDWAGRKFSTIEELLESGGQRVQWGKPHPLSWDQLPAFVLASSTAITPVQFQQFIAVLNGEAIGMDALMDSVGMHVSRHWEPEVKQRQFK